MILRKVRRTSRLEITSGARISSPPSSTTPAARPPLTRIWLTGAALRVPVPVGSITDLTVVLRQTAGVDEVNAAFREAAGSERLRHYLQYSEAPLVSADIVGNPYSSIFDAPLTAAVGNQVKVLGWYDNEWGFANRLVEFSERIGAA